jgi:hypothetical protein
MVTNCQVFGERAGRFAVEVAHCTDARDLPPKALEPPPAGLYEYIRRPRNVQGHSAKEVVDALQAATGKHLVVVRNERGLQTLLSRIEELRGEWLPLIATPEKSTLRLAIEVENALLTAELMARAALAPREPGQPLSGGLSATGRSELAGERAVSGGGGPAVARDGPAGRVAHPRDESWRSPRRRWRPWRFASVRHETGQSM